MEQKEFTSNEDINNFPQANIHHGGIFKTIQIKTINNETQCVNCLISPKTNKIYILQKLLKKALYGDVYYSYVVDNTPHSENGRYIHEYPDNNNLECYAIKVLSKQKLNERKIRHEDPLKEIAAVQSLGNECENIISLYECFSTTDYICCVMKFCDGGDLMDIVCPPDVQTQVVKRKPLLESQSRRYFYDILNGVEYLQLHHICHRDLSLENIVLSNNTCIIIDLGMCIKLPYDELNNEVILVPPQGACGKQNYIAPEILENTEQFNGNKVDVWQLGIMLFIMLCGVPPMETPSVVDARFRLIKTQGGLANLLKRWKIALSEDAVDLLSLMLSVNPMNRPTIAEIKSHPWMLGMIDEDTVIA